MLSDRTDTFVIESVQIEINSDPLGWSEISSVGYPVVTGNQTSSINGDVSSQLRLMTPEGIFPFLLISSKV